MRFLNAFRARGTLLFVSHDEGAVMSLCDRAIWLDKGVARAAGPSKEVCARYRAFLSRGVDIGVAFETGAAAAGGPDLAEPPLKAFDFDLDSSWVRSGQAMIERATLRHPDGKAADTADGGGEVILRVEIRAGRDLDEPIVAFVLRNRLGQVIFRDNTAATINHTTRRIRRGQIFAATFRFRLPHLPTGDYAIEPALFERGGTEPVDRLLDSLFVHVESHPSLGGLANVTMRQKRLVLGEGASARVPVAIHAAAARLIDDDRWHSRNPMEILPFNSAAPWYGHGGATIVDAGFFRPDGTRLTRMHGGDEVELRILAHVERAIERPIVGFMLRNALGQNVFGDNTFIGAPDENRFVAEGEPVTAHFRFQMPFLPVGSYSVAPSIVDGRREGRQHLHWMEEATVIRVAESPVSRVVVGVPMIEISLDLELVEADNPAE
jgi:hypothetical protein